jgi:DNA-binding NarL/FixJ family response regulator
MSENVANASIEPIAGQITSTISRVRSNLVALREQLESVRAATQSLLEAMSQVPPEIANGVPLLAPSEAADCAKDNSMGLQGALTFREAQVLKLVALGNTNKQIGFDLGISVKTVEFHKANALKKLHVHSRAELVGLVVDRGWLSFGLNDNAPAEIGK